jgi:hypothetical protein
LLVPHQLPPRVLFDISRSAQRYADLNPYSLHFISPLFATFFQYFPARSCLADANPRDMGREERQTRPKSESAVKKFGHFGEKNERKKYRK